MSMQVRVGVNGETIEFIYITNQGPPDGRYTDGDHAGGDGPRVYRWATDSDEHGTVTHRRGDGALALVALVVTAVQAARR